MCSTLRLVSYCHTQSDERTVRASLLLVSPTRAFPPRSDGQLWVAGKGIRQKNKGAEKNELQKVDGFLKPEAFPVWRHTVNSHELTFTIFLSLIFLSHLLCSQLIDQAFGAAALTSALAPAA